METLPTAFYIRPCAGFPWGRIVQTGPADDLTASLAALSEESDRQLEAFLSEPVDMEALLRLFSEPVITDPISEAS